jgi:hypothetical protein
MASKGNPAARPLEGRNAIYSDLPVEPATWRWILAGPCELHMPVRDPCPETTFVEKASLALPAHGGHPKAWVLWVKSFQLLATKHVSP